MFRKQELRVRTKEVFHFFGNTFLRFLADYTGKHLRPTEILTLRAVG